MHAESQFKHRYVMGGLLGAWDWFDNGLQNAVRAAGYQPLNKSQSMMVMYVSSGVQRPIAIARKMRLSRQAIRHISTQLIDMGILKARPDPADARALILSFASGSSGMRTFAERTIRRLEGELKKRVGERRYAILSEVLDLDWGPVIAGAKEANGGNEERVSTRRAQRSTRTHRT